MTVAFRRYLSAILSALGLNQERKAAPIRKQADLRRRFRPWARRWRIGWRRRSSA